MAAPGRRTVKVVIAGAGFAGIRTAKALEGKADVTLVAPTDRFVYLPLIHEMVSERQLPRDVTKPLREVLPSTRHVHDRAVAVEGNDLVLASGDRIGFDKLVVAVGAQPNDFGIPGVREHTYSFYSVKDALLANAALKTAAVEHAGRPIRVVVAGASFTGVEVAGEAAELLRRLDFRYDITLLDAGTRLFPHQSDAFRAGVEQGLERLGLKVRMGQRITAVEPGRVHVGDDTVPADVVLWCAGIQPRRIDGVDTNVRPSLQSGDRDDVFVLGDAADFPRGLGVPKLAQTAEGQAPVAAHNVLHPERMRDYKPDIKGLIVSIGHHFAVADIGDTNMTGNVPWHIKRQLYKTKIRLI